MTPSEHRQERDKKLAVAAKAAADALPGHFGSVEINIQAGKPVNVNIRESVKLPQ